MYISLLVSQLSHSLRSIPQGVLGIPYLMAFGACIRHALGAGRVARIES